MKSLFGIVLLAALVQAVPHAGLKGQRYTFQYQSDVIHSIPGAARKQIGLRVLCRCHLDMLTKLNVQVKLEHIQIQQLEMVGDKVKQTPIDAIPEAVKELERPFEAIFSASGLVVSVRAHPEDPEWSLNIKRGLVNLLQVSPKTFQKNPDKMFKITKPVIVNQRENTILGFCPVTYTVVPETHKANIISRVTKTIDYKECRIKSQIKESIFFGKLCASCQKSLGYTPYHRQFGRIEHTFRNARLYEVRSKESLVVTPFSEFGGQVQVDARQLLTLKSTEKSIAKPMAKAKNTGLGFRAVHPEDELRQNVLYENDIGVKVVRLIEQLKATKDLFGHEVPQLFADIVSLARLLKVSAVQKLIETAIQERNQKLRSLLVDAFTLAGTDEVAAVVKDLAEKNKIPVAILERVLFNLPFTPKVGLAHLTAARAICKLPLLLKPELFSTRRQCYLSLGALVNRIAQQTAQQQFFKIQMAITEISKELVTKLMSTKDHAEKIMYLKAIGNAGQRMCRDAVLKHLVDPKLPTELRVQCVWALTKITEMHSTKIMSSLHQIFIDASNAHELRMAVVDVLLDQVPTFHQMQVIVNTIKTELTCKGPRSNQVASWVISKLSYMAYYNNWILKERAMNARLALRLLPYRSFGLSYSKAFRLASYSDKFQTGIDLEINRMNVPQSYLPRNMNANLRVNYMGYTFNVAEIGGRIEGIQNVVQDLLSEVKSARQKRSVWDFIWSSFSSDSHSSSEHPTEHPTHPTDSSSSTDQQTDRPTPGPTLRPSIHDDKQRRPKVSMFMKLFGQELKYAEVTPKLVQQAAEQVIQLLQGKRQTVQTPLGEIQITKNKVVIKQDITKAFLPMHARQLVPTLTGFPLDLHLISSMISDITMDLQVEATPSWWGWLKMDSLKTKMFLRPRISMKTIARVTVHNPFVRVGLEMNNHVYMRPSANIAMEAQPGKQYTWKMENPTKEEEVFVISPNPAKPEDQGVCGIVEVQKVKKYLIVRHEVNLDIPRQHVTQITPVCFDEVITGVKRCIAGEVPSLPALRLREVPVLAALLRTRLRMTFTPTPDAPKQVVATVKVLDYGAEQMCVKARISASGLKIKREIPANITFNFQTRRLVIKTTQVQIPGFSLDYFVQMTADLTSMKSWDLELKFGLKTDPYTIVVQGRIDTDKRRIMLTCAWNKLPIFVQKFLQQYEPQLMYYLQTIASISRRQDKLQQRMDIIIELLTPLTAQLMARAPLGDIQTRVLALPLAVNRLPESYQDVADSLYAVCKLHKQRIELFDQQTIQLSKDKGHCLHILAEDKRREMFRVAASFNKQGQKELLIQIKHPQQATIVVQPSLTVLVNGKQCQQKVCQVQNIARIIKREQRVKIQITSWYSLEVVYQADRIQIRASPMLQDQVRGLCGDNNGEQYREFQSPKGLVLDTAEQFQKAWRLQC